MILILASRIIAALALFFAVIAFGRRLQAFTQLPRPVDRAVPRGNLKSGVMYAYTLGMAPWSKESTRRHAVSYLRGVAFHAGIFLGLFILAGSPWFSAVPQTARLILGVCTAAGALFGFAGLAARLIEPNLKALSTGDDYFAVLVVSLFLASEALWLFVPGAQVFFYLVSAAMLVYAPLGKIRHCFYFAYSRLFYGKFIGSRAVLPHSQQGLR